MKKEDINITENDAKFSDCGSHRLWLSRIWEPEKPFVMFIGLNPSTAGANNDDPTIRRVINFAKYWGFGGVYMVNLFTFISTDPKQLNVKTGNHKHADLALKCVAHFCETIVFAWGNFDVKWRDAEIKAMFPKAIALQINKNGSPKHPLYVKADIVPIQFN